MIDTLREAVSKLSRGAKALKQENAGLRAEMARLRGARGYPASGNDRVDGAELAEVAIRIGAEAPGAAREVVSRCLTGAVEATVLENAQLVVSELVTNSVRHSGASEDDDVVVRVHLWRGLCRIEVEDPGGDGVIAPRPLRPAEGSGMGLNLVQMLSERWGVVRAARGPTRVWAQLPAGAATS